MNNKTSNELNKLFEEADKALDDFFAKTAIDKINKLRKEQDEEDEILHSLQEYLKTIVPIEALSWVRYYPNQKKLREDAGSGHLILFVLPEAYPIGAYLWRHQYTGEWHFDSTFMIIPDLQQMVSKWRADNFLLALGASRRHYKEDAQVLDTVAQQVV